MSTTLSSTVIPGHEHSLRDHINRDFQYRWVAFKDFFRQHARRIALSIQSRMEANKLKNTDMAPYNANPLKLSTCFITMNSAERVEPLLRYVRTFSHEVVVGVDDKSTDHTWQLCEQLKAEGIIDILILVDGTGAMTGDAGLEPVITACTGDWILRLDDDEFPEPNVKDYIQYFIQQPEITHYKQPRIHLSAVYPERNQIEWINDGYLYPDYQLRLFRNDPNLYILPGNVGHLGIKCHGKRGKIHSINLIHLNMAINPRFRREEKLARYIKRHNGQFVHPINEYALLFEDYRYHISPYNSPDPVFQKTLIDTTLHQRRIMERQFIEKYGAVSCGCC